MKQILVSPTNSVRQDIAAALKQDGMDEEEIQDLLDASIAVDTAQEIIMTVCGLAFMKVHYSPDTTRGRPTGSMVMQYETYFD